MLRGEDYLRYVIVLLPAFFLLPVITAPVPITNSHPAVEIAGFYQSLALLQEPVASYTYLTPMESFSALHLHSLLATPFLALDIIWGGRIITLFAALTTALLLIKLAPEIELSKNQGTLAAALFWLNPITVRLASRWWPEMLGVALTTGAIYAAIRAHHDGSRSWYIITQLCVIFGIANHMWEASIALPILTYFVYHGSYRRAFGTSLTAIVAAVVVFYITHLQPIGGSSLTHFAVWNNPLLLFSINWWNHVSEFPIHPLQIVRTVFLPLAVVLFTWFAIRARNETTEQTVVVSAWLASGLLIPIMLPGGADNHIYYLWGLLVPVVIALVYILSDFISTLERSLIPAVIVVGLALVYILVFEAALLSGAGIPLISDIDGPREADTDVTSKEVISVGEELRRYDIKNASGLTFVGDWGGERSIKYQDRISIAQVLIYSKTMIRTRHLDGSDAPRIEQNDSDIIDCEVMIYKHKSNLSIAQCE